MHQKILAICYGILSGSFFYEKLCYWKDTGHAITMATMNELARLVLTQINNGCEKKSRAQKNVVFICANDMYEYKS